MEEKIAIIILNYRNYKLSEECVNNLIDMGIKSKIVIVDNNSNNNSYEYLKEKFKSNENIDVIENPKNVGYAAGNNVGIRYILNKDNNIKYVAIMNPDIILTYREILSNLAEKLDKNDDIAVISGMMIWKKDLNIQSVYWNIPTDMELIFEHFNLTNSYFSKRNKKRIGLCPDRDGIARVEVVPGCFFIIKRHVLEEINMFDEGTFLYNEENVLAVDMKKRGYKEAISISDYYIHNHNPSIGLKTLKQWYNLSKIGYNSRKYLCSKYDRKGTLSILLAIIQALNYVEVTFRFMGSCVKRKIRGGTNS